jgi:alkylation response protein AidB-like acyl-CoA dehydrogenase
MEFAYTPEQQELSQQIISFAKSQLNKDVIGRDRNQIFSKDLWIKCGAMGIQGLPVPEEYGGLGLDALSTSIGLEAFGYGSEDGGLNFSICAHLLACVIPIWKFGNEEQKKKYLPELCSGRMIAVNGMTETTSGSDAFHMSTKAVAEGKGYRINGRKIFASNGPIADLAVVYASTDSTKGYFGGTTAFLIEKGTKGFESGQAFEQMGLRTCKIGELVFDDVFVEPEMVLGAPGAGSTLFTSSMDWERICIGATHVGTMQRIFETTMEYARTRESAGRKIGSYQAISHRIADMKIRLEASRLLTYKAAWSMDHKVDVTLNASITKLHASESLVEIAREALQIFGGYGFMTEYQIERALRDAMASTLYSGTSEIQRNIIASWLGLKS